MRAYASRQTPTARRDTARILAGERGWSSSYSAGTLTWHVKANMMMEMAGKVLIDGDHSLIGSSAGNGSAIEAHVACTITESTR
eukprot:scaffold85975_cov62-Phaeocystis_antarctica.AAC.3